MKIALLGALLSLTISLPVGAQMVVKADMARLQPQIDRDEDGFRACGIRALVMVTIGKDVEMHDFSVVMNSSAPFGLIKAGKWLTTTAEMVAGKSNQKAELRPISSFWVAEALKGKSLNAKNLTAAQNPGFVLGYGEFEPSFNAVIAIATGKSMQFATRYKHESLDRVIAFDATLQPEELMPLTKCLEGVIGRMEEPKEAAK